VFGFYLNPGHLRFLGLLHGVKLGLSEQRPCLGDMLFNPFMRL
jgi:hypothetical protein